MDVHGGGHNVRSTPVRVSGNRERKREHEDENEEDDVWGDLFGLGVKTNHVCKIHCFIFLTGRILAEDFAVSKN